MGVPCKIESENYARVFVMGCTRNGGVMNGIIKATAERRLVNVMTLVVSMFMRISHLARQDDRAFMSFCRIRGSFMYLIPGTEHSRKHRNGSEMK